MEQLLTSGLRKTALILAILSTALVVVFVGTMFVSEFVDISNSTLEQVRMRFGFPGLVGLVVGALLWFFTHAPVRHSEQQVQPIAPLQPGPTKITRAEFKAWLQERMGRFNEADSCDERQISLVSGLCLQRYHKVTSCHHGFANMGELVDHFYECCVY